MLIQKLRLERGWSRQQLAEASGLSVRTIRPGWFLGPQWEREQVEKRPGRPL